MTWKFWQRKPAEMSVAERTAFALERIAIVLTANRLDTNSYRLAEQAKLDAVSESISQLHGAFHAHIKDCSNWQRELVAQLATTPWDPPDQKKGQPH